jgi:hypothetical protein
MYINDFNLWTLLDWQRKYDFIQIKLIPKLKSKTNNYVPYGDMVKDQVGELCDKYILQRLKNILLYHMD